MAVFADASYVIALVDPKDQWHKAATALLGLAERMRPVHCHALIAAEVVAVVGSARGGAAARTAYDVLRDDTVLHLPTQEDLDASMDLVVRHDGGISLSDALAVRLMEREGIAAILSFDKGFDATGVRRLSSPPS